MRILFEITALYEMKKMNDQKTHFKYTTTNKPLKWFLKFFMMFATEKVVVEFVERVKMWLKPKNSHKFGRNHKRR